MKNTIALAWDNQVVVSPHIGDLDSPRSLSVFEQVIRDLQKIYNIKPAYLVCDSHPAYASTKWAKQQDLPHIEVLHHHAHASMLPGEFPEENTWLVFTWDGVGYGEDGSLWGGEALFGYPGAWTRAASFRPFHLTGGDKVSRQPWRSALALCWETNRKCSFTTHAELELIYQAWQNRVNTMQSSAVGRLFDAASALLDGCITSSFEGQAPMWLEQTALHGRSKIISLPLNKTNNMWICDWEPLLVILNDKSLAIADRARSFHDSLAHSLCEQAQKIREEKGDFAVGLSGGVFQNKILAETVITELQRKSFRVYFPENIPVNDGGLCYGQIIEAANHR